MGAICWWSFRVTSARGAGDPKVSQIFVCGKCLCIYTILVQIHSASDLDQRGLRMHQNVFLNFASQTPNSLNFQLMNRTFKHT